MDAFSSCYSLNYEADNHKITITVQNVHIAAVVKLHFCTNYLSCILPFKFYV